MMMNEIMTRTPVWVFGLLVVLLYFGVAQAKTRTVPKRRVAILPIVMIVLSLSGIFSAFGANIIAIMAWLAALIVVLLVSTTLKPNDCITFSTATQKFNVPGSWIPMLLMMAIFIAKYVVAVVLAYNSSLRHSVSFIIGVSFIYGFLSSVFFARAWRVWSAQKNTVALHLRIDVPKDA
jgi:hypothetical protein